MAAPSPSPQSESAQDSASAWRWTAWLLPLLVALATTASFWPCVHHEFVQLDDDANFTLNYRWRGLGPEQWSWLWNESHYGHWHPLTWLTFCAEYVLWGAGPGGQPIPQPYHRTNVALHVLGALAFYALALELLRRAFAERSVASATLRTGAFLAAVAWALHPLRVESVAWVTERRDVLSGLFLSLTVLAYLRATRSAGASLAWMGLALVSYVASVLSKAWGITLPAVLLVLDLYPLRRIGPLARDGVGWNRIVVEKLAFGAVALWAAVQAAGAQADIRAVMSLAEHGLLDRAAQGSYGLVFYVLKTLWPVDLACHYLLDVEFVWSRPIHLAAMAAVAVLSIALIAMRRRWPAALATWVQYAILVSPVLGVLQSGSQKVADRYAYIASQPFSIALAAGMVAWTIRGGAGAVERRRRGTLAAAVLLALVLAPLTWRQTLVWRDSEALFRQAVKVEPDNYFAAHNLAVTLYQKGAYAEALEVEKQSVAAHPGYGNHQARSTLGILYERMGRSELAEQAYRETVAIAPDNAGALHALRSMLLRRGDQEGVLALYEQALRTGESNRRQDSRRPVLTDVYADLAQLYVQRGRFDDARALWERARDNGVHASRTENGIGKLYLAQGRFAEAEEHLLRAQQYDARNADYLLDLCDLFVRSGRAQQALINVDKVLAIDPNNVRARGLRQQALARGGGQ